MFDPQALSKAMSEGIMELLFVLSAPIIFLGLAIVCIFSLSRKKDRNMLK